MKESGYLTFKIYRGVNTSSDQLIFAFVDEVKNYVFEPPGVEILETGYSGIPLVGHISLKASEDEISKVLSVLFRLSIQNEGLVFKISTNEAINNPLLQEALRNDVIPKWAESNEIFVESIYGYCGVVHALSPSTCEKHPGEFEIDVLRKEAAQTRNILITEAIKQKLDNSLSRGFGMHPTTVNVPASLAYVARERPDILSIAIRSLSESESPARLKNLEDKLVTQDCVMVHILVNETDWKNITAVADIESPADITSHRVGLALLAFDEKMSSQTNGTNGVEAPTGTFQKVTDRFEKERLEAVKARLFGKPHSVTAMYHHAKHSTTSKQHAECRKIFVDESSSADQHSVYSGDEEDSYEMSYARKQVFKKKKARNGDLGKKRELASVITKSDFSRAPVDEEDLPTPTSSGQLKCFERAVNGEDVYKESSDGDSLGEEEDMNLFVTKPKKQILNDMMKKRPNKNPSKALERIESEDDGFDVADLLRAAPPLAKNDEFDDFDGI